MKLFHLGFAALAAMFATSLIGQSSDAVTDAPQTTLKVNSRAVLVDVIVTDRNGNPIKGLKQEDFKVLEQGKSQNIGYFEEHSAARIGPSRSCRPTSSPISLHCQRPRP